MTGSLIQLVAFGVQDVFFKKRYSTEYLLVDFEKTKLLIQRTADLCIPLHIVITMKKEMNSEDFVTLVSSSILKFFMGSNLLFEFNLEFLIKLNPIKKVNKSFIIKLPFDTLIGHIILISLQNLQCVMELQIANFEPIDKISALFEWIYLDTEERRTYAQHIIYQKIFNVKRIESYKNYLFFNNYSYKIDFDNNHNKLGFFIESEKEINSINILFDNKVRTLENCNIINNNLLYFSFNNLTFTDNKNMTVAPIKIINSIIVLSTSNNLKFYSHHFNINYYNYGMVHPYSQFYDTSDICIYQNNIKYNMCNKITSNPIVITEIANQKVFDFINENVNNNLINDLIKDTNISIIRFFDCTVDSDIVLPSHINIIILEKCKIDFTNISFDVSEIWLIDSKEQTNLPFGLNKLRLFGKYDVANMKIPFNCEIEHISM